MYLCTSFLGFEASFYDILLSFIINSYLDTQCKAEKAKDLNSLVHNTVCV